jgi:hypothetical protein
MSRSKAAHRAEVGPLVGQPAWENPAGGDDMSEARATGPHRDLLLATKFVVPRARPGGVGRPALLRRLRAAGDRAVILVCASAGFGKSITGIDDGAMPDILTWTADRFAGVATPSTCAGPPS